MSLHETETERMPGGISVEMEEIVLDAESKVEEQASPPHEQKERGSDSRAEDKHEDPWRTVLDIGIENDKELIDNWKDEMNNLLIFAGLFSAVVTAFTVESYQWLQDVPEDPSVILLTRISDQLSSFTTPFGFINSSTAAATATTTAPSTPSHSGPPAVSINILWFLSLTLSLISAFYAITVQQWLRQLTIPRYLLPRDAARLRQWRYDSLMAWQVPSIIALLPLLIQIAVILFLVGVLLLLDSLHHAVASAFTAVAGVCLILFAITVFWPLVTTRCPYKSPLIPSVLAVLQWCIAPLVVPAFLMIVIVYLAGATVGFAFLPCVEETDIAEAFDSFLAVLNLALESLNTVISPTTIGMERFWMDREMERLSQESHNLQVDVPALSQAVAAATGPRASQLHQVLATLPTEWKTRCATLAVATTIGLRHTVDLVFNDEEQFHHLLIRLVHARTNTPLHDDHVALMVEVLSLDWPAKDWLAEDSDIARLLLLLQLATLTEKLSSSTFFHILTGARSSQRINGDVSNLTLELRIPTVLMCLQLYSSTDVDIDQELALSMTTWAVQCLKSADAAWVEQSKTFVRSVKVVARIVEFALAASAVAFRALSKQPEIASTHRSDIETILSSVSEFLDKHQSRVVTAIRLFKSKREEYSLFTIKEAIEIMCQSLADLATSHHLPLDANCASKTVADRLYEICKKHEDYREANIWLLGFKAAAEGVQATSEPRRRWRALSNNILAVTRLRRRVPRGIADPSLLQNIPRSGSSALKANRTWDLSAAGARRSLVPCHSLAPMHDLLLRKEPELPPGNDVSDDVSPSIDVNAISKLSMLDSDLPIVPSSVAMPVPDPPERPSDRCTPFTPAESAHDAHNAASRISEVDEPSVPRAADSLPAPCVSPDYAHSARGIAASDRTPSSTASLHHEVVGPVLQNADADGPSSRSGPRAAGAHPPLLSPSFSLPTPELTPMHEILAPVVLRDHTAHTADPPMLAIDDPRHTTATEDSE